MPRAIRFNDRTNLTSGIARLGQRMGRPGTVAEQAHDGGCLSGGPVKYLREGRHLQLWVSNEEPMRPVCLWAAVFCRLRAQTVAPTST